MLAKTCTTEYGGLCCKDVIFTFAAFSAIIQSACGQAVYAVAMWANDMQCVTHNDFLCVLTGNIGMKDRLSRQ
jgi:hypothetical protein